MLVLCAKSSRTESIITLIAKSGQAVMMALNYIKNLVTETGAGTQLFLFSSVALVCIPGHIHDAGSEIVDQQVDSLESVLSEPSPE